MSFWDWLTRRRPDHGWPGYIINGRIRTSTAALIVAFIAIAWLHNAYQPPPPAATAPETQVVPPGFVPDPEYTWVPRTYVDRPKTTTTTTTTTEPTTTEASPTQTSPTTGTNTVLNDPDGPGPLPATTVTETPATSPGTVTSTVPSTTVTTTVSSPSPPWMPLAPPR